MAAAITEIGSANAGGTAITAVLSASVAVGDLIIVFGQESAADTQAAGAVTDAQDGTNYGSNTYSVTGQTAQNATATRASIWYSVCTKPMTASVSTIKFTLSSTAVKSFLVWKLSGAYGITLDKSATSNNQATTTTPVTGTTAVTTQPIELVIAMWHYANLVTPPSFTAPGGFSQTATTKQAAAGAVTVNQSAAYKFVTVAGTQAGTATLGSTQTAGGAIATYKYSAHHPQNPAVNFIDPAVLMQRFRQRIRHHGRIFVPDLWLPEPCL